MDEQDPSKQRPLSNHPNAVNSVPNDTEPVEDDAPTPRPSEPLPHDYYKNKSKKGKYLIIALILLLIIGGAVYWFILREKPAKDPETSSTNSTQTAKTDESSTDTEHYDSANFNLGFDHPKDWKVSDIAGSGKLIVTSPVMKLKDADGQQVDGQIVMTIRDKTQKLSEFDKGAATAVIDSEKISYTKPTETQRGDTYISFLNYASSTDKGLDSIYISGDSGYQKEQDIPAVDISKVDPITNVTFVSSNKAIAINSDSWTDSSFSKPIKSLLQSLAIQ